MSDRQVKTLRELTVLVTEHLNTAVCNAGKLDTTRQILTEAQTKADEQNAT